MKYTNLKENPQFIDQTLALIEASFNYSKENSFKIDFNPLMRKENWEHCHLLINNEKVIGHIGILKKSFNIKNQSFKVIMYGGIAIDDQFRGKGLFKKFFNSLISKYNDTSLHMLWSDQVEMYEKFNFHPCIDQYEYNHSLEDAEEFVPTKLDKLSKNEIQTLNTIYNSQPELRLSRSVEDWSQLAQITSSDLYLKTTEGKISNYFFMNKGEDLQDVIIEVGDFNDSDKIINYGVLWSPHMFEMEDKEEIESLYASLIRIGNHSNFTSFIENYTDSMIEIKEINHDEIVFIFESNEITLNHFEFLTGILGPNSFEELRGLSPIYISGLDSI